MTSEWSHHIDGTHERPTRESIEREKRLQDEAVVDLRRLLAKTQQEELLLHSAA